MTFARAASFATVGFASLLPFFQAQDPSPKPTSTAAKPLQDMLGQKAFAECGLAALSDEQLRRLLATLQQVVGRAAATSRLAATAEAHLLSEGWKKVEVEWVTVRGRELVVVNTGLSTHATEDVPLRLSSLTAPNGAYLAQPDTFGGIKSMLDKNGTQHSFRFATWKEL